MKEKIKWMDYCGAPAILISERILKDWNGMYLPMNQTVVCEADIVLEDGQMFQLYESLDFANPKTDYERICGKCLDTHQLCKLGDNDTVVFSDEGDGLIGWWDEHNILITISGETPPISILNELVWETPIVFHFDGSKHFLSNSTFHWSEIVEQNQQVTVLSLFPGTYSISTSMASFPYVWRFFRFSLLDSL